MVSRVGNSKQTSSRKSSSFFIVTYLLPLRAFDLPGLAPNSMKYNFRNSWKSVSLTVERAQAETSLAMQLPILYEFKMDEKAKVDKLVDNNVLYCTAVNRNRFSAINNVFYQV